MYRFRSTSGLYGNMLFWWRFPTELFKDNKHSEAFLNFSMLWFLNGYSLSSLKFMVCNMIFPFFSTDEAGIPSVTDCRPSPKSLLLLQDDWFKMSPNNRNSTNKFHELHIKCIMHLQTCAKEERVNTNFQIAESATVSAHNQNSQLNQ